MSRDIERIDRASERRIQAMFDRAHFDDLYDTAVEVFLTKPPEISELDGPSLDQSIVAACGVRGLALALDGKRRQQIYSDNEDKEDGYFLIGTDSIIRYPHVFSAPVDRGIQQKIENLGTGLLDEAFEVLGTDVKTHIEKYRNAKTPEEQMAVLAWLDERCFQMTRANRDGISYTDFAYHPTRLSPKLIGQYPHNDLTPTCLSFGIITASFLRQAGAPTLQGGVANTHYDSLRKYYYYESLESYYQAREKGFPSVEVAAGKAAKWAMFDYQDIGFHAASYAQLMDGSWYCVDPNYHLSYQLDDYDSDLLQHAYDDLVDIRGVATGIEVPVQLGHASASVTISECLDLVRKFKLDESCIKRVLIDDDVESLPFKVFAEIARQVDALHEETEDDASKSLLYVMTFTDSERMFEDQHGFGYWHEYLAAWDKHVLHGMDIQDFIQKCRTDNGFLERRVEDIQLLPTMALEGLLAREMENFKAGLTNGKNKHDFIEVGLPEYRVGCSVLSDLAVYTQAPLSPQFFLSYWPSRIPVTETRGTISRDRSGVLESNMMWMDFTDFYYPQQYGIIKRHLSGKPTEPEE